jgi:DeoR/GlpR family transcriptional regulator of sugar metabolism
MIAAERRANLLQELNKNEYIQVAELAHQFNISNATIRRDLTFMEKEGLCVRKRGGAIRSIQGVTLELPYNVKQNKYIAEKKRIADAAANLVQDGNTLILDAGSTTYALACRLAYKRRITVVTNDLQIAVKLAANPNISLNCTGGIARANVFSLQGSQVEAFFNNIHVDKTFLGADAIHSDGTISNVNIEEVSIKRAMIRAAKEVVLVVDSSKFEKTGFAKVGCLSEVHTIITDSGIPKSALDLLESLNIKIIIA